jgi:copper chaperone
MHRFKVEGMSCSHCVAAITREIQAADPAARVQVDLATSRVEVESSLTTGQLIAQIDQAGYAAHPAEPE